MLKAYKSLWMAISVSVNIENNKQSQSYACVKFFWWNKFNAYKQFRTLYAAYILEIVLNLLEPKRMQVFPLHLQYQKVWSDFFRK